MSKQNRFKTVLSILSIAIIIFGIFLTIRPAVSLKIVGYIFAVIAVFNGISRISGHFSSEFFGVTYRFDLVHGIISTIIGIIAFFIPQSVSAFLPVVIGIYILAESIFRIQSSLEFKKAGYGKWSLDMLLGILFALCGIVIIINPFSTMVLATRIIGIALICAGVFQLVTTLYISSKVDAMLPVDAESEVVEDSPTAIDHKEK